MKKSMFILVLAMGFVMHSTLWVHAGSEKMQGGKMMDDKMTDMSGDKMKKAKTDTMAGDKMMKDKADTMAGDKMMEGKP